MGYKIFVSYKYHDDSVYPLQTFMHAFPFYNSTTTVRNYIDKVESYFEHTENQYKGESDNEDLSYLSEDAIWERLKTKIYDSSVTIVMISPKMKEQYKSERSQWIPWEIAYSLRETTRGDRTSHSNAVLAVVLPDKSYQYTYFTEPFSYQSPNGIFNSGNDSVFSIIRKNMNNRLNFNNAFFAGHGMFNILVGDESYIPSVTWDDFIKTPMRYVEYAVRHKEMIFNYNICKDVDSESDWRF